MTKILLFSFVPVAFFNINISVADTLSSVSACMLNNSRPHCPVVQDMRQGVVKV